MSLDFDERLFDYDGDGELDPIEQNEYELFEFGDGSVHEPDGVDFSDDYDDNDDREDEF